MFSNIRQHVERLLRKKQKVRPLVSTKKDVQMVQAIHSKKLPNLKQIRRVGNILSDAERRVIKTAILVLILGVAWSFLVIVDDYRVKVPKVGGKYTEAVVGSPQLVNPIFASLNDIDLDITKLTYTGLMRYTKNQELIPDLAESYTISDDKKTYIFNLRKDIAWHDGNPFTARDVLYTIQTIQDPFVNSPLLVGFKGVGVEALDDYTVQFELQEPFSPFLGSLTVGILPEHVWFDVSPERMRLHRQNIQPVGTGPFMFKKLTKDDTGFIFNYDLVRFEKFYREPAFIEEFSFQFFGEYEGPSGAIQSLRSQRVDGLSFVPHDLKEKVERKSINLHTLQLPQYTALFFNQDEQALLKDANLREAMALALDKDRILRDALKDEGKIINSPILPGFPGFDPNVETNPYDRVKANEILDKNWNRISAEEFREKRREQLLEEREEALDTAATSTLAVVSEEGETSTTTEKDNILAEIETILDNELNSAQTFYRQTKEGKTLVLDLVTADTPEYRSASALMAGFWQEIGIKTNIELVDPKEISRLTLKDRDYDVLLYGMILGSDPDQYPFWHSTQIDFPGLNLARYVNRSVDTLLQNIRETDDETKVEELSKQFQEKILADKPAIFLYMPTYTYATREALQGLDVIRIFHPADRFANVTEWFLETKGEWNFGDNSSK